MTYWQRLKRHPGVGIAALMTVAGALAGASRGDGIGVIIFGAVIMGLCVWTPVLLTARKGEGEE